MLSIKMNLGSSSFRNFSSHYIMGLNNVCSVGFNIDVNIHFSIGFNNTPSQDGLWAYIFPGIFVSLHRWLQQRMQQSYWEHRILFALEMLLFEESWHRYTNHGSRHSIFPMAICTYYASYTLLVLKSDFARDVKTHEYEFYHTKKN